MDSSLYCTVCDLNCGNASNYSSHVSGKQHLKKAALIQSTPTVTQQVFMDFDNDDDFYPAPQSSKSTILTATEPKPVVLPPAIQ